MSFDAIQGFTQKAFDLNILAACRANAKRASAFVVVFDSVNLGLGQNLRLFLNFAFVLTQFANNSFIQSIIV